jgi:hypothetical protein
MTACLLGEVRILRPASGALTAVLSGVDGQGRPTEIGLVGARLGALPELLRDARVERDGERLHLVLAGQKIELVAASFHVHHDLAAVIGATVPARPVRPARRLLLGALLRLAQSRAGFWLLRRLRPAPRVSAH